MSKRSDRRWRTQKILLQRLPFAEIIHCSNGKPLPAKARGRCRVMHPFDCGRPHCVCCNFVKIFDIPDIQKVRADIDLKEQVHEYFAGGGEEFGFFREKWLDGEGIGRYCS